MNQTEDESDVVSGANMLRAFSAVYIIIGRCDELEGFTVVVGVPGSVAFSFAREGEGYCFSPLDLVLVEEDATIFPLPVSS